MLTEKKQDAKPWCVCAHMPVCVHVRVCTCARAVYWGVYTCMEGSLQKVLTVVEIWHFNLLVFIL